MGTLSLAAPLVLFEKSRLWAGTGFHLLPSFHHHPLQHNYTTQLLHIDHTQRFVRNPKRVIVQWVGIGTHTHTHTEFLNLFTFNNNILAKIIYLSWNPVLKLLYLCPETSTEKFLMLYLKTQMRMKHFGIHILQLVILIFRKLIDHHQIVLPQGRSFTASVGT